MKLRTSTAIVFAVPLLLLASMLWCDGGRFRTRLVEAAAAVPVESQATEEQAVEMCERAMLPVAGVRPGMKQDELERLLRASFSQAAVQTLMSSYADHRVVPADGELFFPNRHLCSQATLRGKCAALCREYMKVAQP